MSRAISKFLSYVLRHAPESIGLSLDVHGWADVNELITKANSSGQALNYALLERIVAEDDKKRFTLSSDGTHIRAAQGHSVTVDLGHAPVAPPDLLYHGTATRFVESIRQKRLVPGNRQQVHLSTDVETATWVGQRHGKPIVLMVAAARMAADGLLFFRAENSVWLTDNVPATYLSFPDAG